MPHELEAFGAVYADNWSQVRAYVYSLTNNAAWAEDLASEAFVRALAALHRYTCQGRGIDAWLFTIARNLVRDHFKSADVRKRVALPALPEQVSSEGDPEAHLYHRQLADALEAALEELTEPQRRCLTLRFKDELSIREIAAAMGKSEPTVRQLQHRAVQALQSRVSSAWATR